MLGIGLQFMITIFQSVAHRLFGPSGALLDARVLCEENLCETCSLTASFLLALGGDRDALLRLQRAEGSNEYAGFLRRHLGTVEEEIRRACESPDFRKRLQALDKNPSDTSALRMVFFPEGAGLPETREEKIEALRQRRTIRITSLNPSPLSDPVRQMLFTSNVLLTVPLSGSSLDEINCTDELKARIRSVAGEEQMYWYDHPIPVGVRPEANEILYGLRGLDTAAEFERARGLMGPGKIACALSVSVTHRGLQDIARQYIESEIRSAGGFRNVDVYVFTEADTRRLIREVLVPAGGDEGSLKIFGVDGEYGRHYSFLKAVAALWQAAADPGVQATFKIDLDQVFPQKELVEQTGKSAFEHFKSPLWGAHGQDADGFPVELGMIAGALVNERDIDRGIFTPDVSFPDGPAAPDERIFFSRMTMALSTRAEMMTRYRPDGIDGKTACIQRIHVTGGTNGIRIDSLRKHRPFTPSFIGRAEDQSYLLSVLLEEGEKLRYVHKDGLIMRHDKEAFAGDAIRAASFGNIIGDYIRTLYFSEYARVLDPRGLERIKSMVDPFTGCFITPIPVIVVMLRFCLKAAGYFLAGDGKTGTEFVEANHIRLERAMAFAREELKQQYEREREGWNRYYELLDRLQHEPSLKKRAGQIIQDCRVRT